MEVRRIALDSAGLTLLCMLALSCNGTDSNGGGGGDDGGGGLVAHRLEVVRHTLTTIDGTRADAVLSDGAGIARSADGPDDVACGIDLLRSGELGTFTTGTGIINSGVDFDAVRQLPGYVKVVNQINWCGGFQPGIIGCAPVPGDSMVVVRHEPAGQEGILWLHEFAHTKGRHHRDDPDAVMYFAVGDTRRELDADECQALENLDAATVAADGSALVAMTEVPRVGDLVRRTFVHGLPYEVASQYDRSVVPMLLDLLADPAEEPYWVNVVTVLGAVGDDAVATELIELIESGEGTLSRDAYNARTAAVMALGYLANRGSGVALDYLVSSSTAEAWVAKDLAWTSPYQQEPLERDLQLAQVDIMALALSGREPAMAALRELRVSESGRQPAVLSVLDEAIAAHRTVEGSGLSGYSRTASSGRPLTPGAAP